MRTILHNMLLLLCLWSVHTPSAKAADCHERIAIAPPYVKDTDYARWLAQQASRTLRQIKGDACPIILDYEQTINAFDYIGMSHFFTRAPASLEEKQLLILKKDTAATHVLVITPAESGTEAIMTLYRMDMLQGKLKRVAHYPFEVDKEGADQVRLPLYLRILSVLTPNALTLGLSSTQVDFDVKTGYEINDNKVASAIPPIISSVSFTKIEHPGKYDTLDYSFTIFPGNFIFAIDQYTTLQRREDAPPDIGPRTKRLHVSVYGVCSNLNGEAALYWSLGTTYTSLGYGPCLFQSQQELDVPLYQINMAVRFVAGHRVFLKRNLYGFLDADYLFFSSRLYQADIANASRISRATLGLGWYFPDVESTFIKAWHGIF